MRRNFPPNQFYPYNADGNMTAPCACCGNHHQTKFCLTPNLLANEQEIQTQLIEDIAIKAIFPHEPTRRAFLKAVGKTTAMAAIASVLPLASLQEAAAFDRLTPEKKTLNVAFLPILCATPLIMADPLGYYAEQGIKVNLLKM